MYRTGCNAYQHSAGNTVEDKSQILLKLYDGAIRFVNVAQKGIMEKRVNVRGENISKVMAIITELNCALDMERGGQVAQHLASLYQYIMGKLTLANQQNNASALQEVKDILVTLKEGFEGAASQSQPKRQPSNMYEEECVPQEGLRCAI